MVKAAAGAELTKAEFLGTERRWRRFGEPVAAGESRGADGSPDYGLFGPGSVAWEVLLHPATIVFESMVQGHAQLMYKPIAAGIRDRDPISRKGREGSLTFFDSFERFQRNAGMHAPIWMGDTETATRMTKHLRQIHKRVAGDVIDVSEPALGGYDASAPRDAMWAALTEMHPILRGYEAFAFRGWRFPRRLPAHLRDQYIAECADYVRLVGGFEEQIPSTMSELAALYEEYAPLFGHSATINIVPETGEDYQDIMAEAMKKNFHRTQIKAIAQLMLLMLFKPAVLGALSGKARAAAGLSPLRSRLAVIARYLSLPAVWLMQRRPIERYYLRLMWGPDGQWLIERARTLHREAGGVTSRRV